MLIDTRGSSLLLYGLTKSVILSRERKIGEGKVGPAHAVMTDMGVGV